VLQQKVDVRKYLTEKELGSKLLYLTDLQELVGLQQDLLVQKSRHLEALEAIAALMETQVRTAAEYQRTLLDELTKAEQKAAGLLRTSLKRSNARNCNTSPRRSMAWCSSLPFTQLAAW
jgi:hemolysin D